MNKAILDQVSKSRLQHDLFYLCRDPLPFRTVNYKLPWHDKCSLDEADEFIAGELRKTGAAVELQANRVQAFRCNPSRPLHHWYDAPHPEDPWYDAHNIVANLPGAAHSEEIIQLVSHKDSQSWICSSGAYDNCSGTVINMELMRILAAQPRQRTIRVLFCNEEHSPWHSLTFAKAAAERGDRLLAVLNQDSLGGQSDEDSAAGIRGFASTYSTPEGMPLAKFMVAENERYQLGMKAYIADKGFVNDDDGNFIKCGYKRAVINEGSSPYAEPHYHLPTDIPESVDLESLRLSAQLVLAAILDLDADGEKALNN